MSSKTNLLMGELNEAFEELLWYYKRKRAERIIKTILNEVLLGKTKGPTQNNQKGSSNHP